MTISKEEARAKAAATYNATSDHYDQPALSFWDRYGRRTIERLSLQPGAAVRGFAVAHRPLALISTA
jgi:hypothetical protein